MKELIQKLAAKAIVKKEEGLTTVEYALLLVVIALAAWGAFQGLGTAVSTQADKAAKQLTNG